MVVNIVRSTQPLQVCNTEKCTGCRQNYSSQVLVSLYCALHPYNWAEVTVVSVLLDHLLAGSQLRAVQYCVMGVAYYHGHCHQESLL